ncbi:basic membrane protein A [Desulfohalotomaculum tongense]|uniref:BMP family ABC transporter substrate-binding protein n=1 Tax=Desulforadius tongensis TaxID=1216062 RepID=UPI0019560A68|nr:BMP family ABC transporter substrate-binding protein [Desulforadius tongensis]MBM7855911.1 basic membrane protein A [Desulforadius tongensis]
MVIKKRSVIALLLVLSLALLLVGCGGEKQPAGDSAAPEAQGEKMKVGFIYVGPPGDAGYTYAHDQGRKYLEEHLPYVETKFMESVPEGAASESYIQQFVQEGCDVIFTTSFGYMDSTIKVAERNKDVVFLHCSGYKTAENVGNYFGRMYQARYLTGIVAGKQTKSNLIGYVAAHPIPEVIRGINAFTLGVRSVNPEAKVKVVWTNTWYDPVKEKDAAKALLDDGCDVIAQHQDTPGPQQAAEEKGVYGVGYNSDMSKMAPKAVLTSAVWNWGPYYVETVKAVKEGTWKSGSYWGGLKEGVVGLAPYGPMVAEETKQLVEAKKQEIIAGKWDVFTGPIKDQDGKTKVAEGEKLTDSEILEMNWFVEGVIGTIPKKK